jgi:hypothetical protein
MTIYRDNVPEGVKAIRAEASKRKGRERDHLLAAEKIAWNYWCAPDRCSETRKK